MKCHEEVIVLRQSSVGYKKSLIRFLQNIIMYLPNYMGPCARALIILFIGVRMCCHTVRKFRRSIATNASSVLGWSSKSAATAGYMKQMYVVLTLSDSYHTYLLAVRVGYVIEINQPSGFCKRIQTSQLKSCTVFTASTYSECIVLKLKYILGERYWLLGPGNLVL
jgi:hypothetical protein